MWSLVTCDLCHYSWSFQIVKTTHSWPWGLSVTHIMLYYHIITPQVIPSLTQIQWTSLMLIFFQYYNYRHCTTNTWSALLQGILQHHTGWMRLIHHTLTQERHMRLINNMHLIARFYGNNIIATTMFLGTQDAWQVQNTNASLSKDYREQFEVRRISCISVH